MGQLEYLFFLVLSGFLFARQAILQPEKIQFSHFIIKRIIRIFPLLIFVFLMIIAASRATSTPMDILRLITLQLNTGQSFTGWGHDFLPVGPIWTIAVEFQFYLLFPVLYVAYIKNNHHPIKSLLWLVITINLFKIIFMQIHPEMWWNLYHTLFGRLDQFIIGMIVGVMYINKNKFVILHGKYTFILYLVILLAYMWFFYGLEHTIASKALNFLFESFLFAGIILSYISTSFHVNRNIGNAFSYLGQRSYSIYILHLLIGGVIISNFNLQHNTLVEYFPNLII